MTERTICPACSAPLAYDADDRQVLCDFCGAGYTVVLEGDQIKLQLVSQPQPQKDELSQAANALAQNMESEAVNDIVEPFPGTIREADGEPLAPGFASSATQQIDVDPVSMAALNPEPPNQYQPVTDTARPNSNRKGYIAAGVSVFVVVCLLCLCVAGGVIMFMNTTGGQLSF